MGQRYTVGVHIDPGLDERVIADAPADHLYRIAHAAVTSAARQRGCTAIDVGLRVDSTELVLTVSDDGRGLDYERLAEDGVGLRLMEYRTRIIGGTIVVQRSADAGARVEVRVPMQRVRHVAPGGDT